MRTGTALAEGFFWMAEELRYGYETTAPDPQRALKLYRQSAELGFPRACLRVGEIYERGVGVPANPVKAFTQYRRAAEQGEITGYAAMARLVSRRTHHQRAESIWRRYFEELERGDHRDLGIDEPAASIHGYLLTKLWKGEEPVFYPVMDRFRDDLIAYLQRYLQHARGDQQLVVTKAMMAWIGNNLRR
jgi:TPR repeat protein